MVYHDHVNKWPGDHFDQFLPPHCHGDAVRVQLPAGSAADQDAFLHASYVALVGVGPLEEDKYTEVKRLRVKVRH